MIKLFPCLCLCTVTLSNTHMAHSTSPPSPARFPCVLYWPGLGRLMLYLARGESQCPVLVSLPSTVLFTTAPTAGATRWGPGSGGSTHQAGWQYIMLDERAKRPVSEPAFPSDYFGSQKSIFYCQVCWYYTPLITHTHLQSLLHTEPSEHLLSSSLGYPPTHKECT